MAPRTTYATLADGLQPFSLWDQSLADMGLLGTIPCSATGTNAITLTPLTVAFAPNITAYTNYLTFSFVPTNTTTGSVTAQIGSLGLKNVYLTDGVTQATTGSVIINSIYTLVYSSSLNGSVGGFYLNSSSGSSIINTNNTWIGDQYFKSGRPWFDVRAFGALGNGVADDSAAIQAAFDATVGKGGVVFFPIGHYNVNTGVTLSQPNVQIWGCGLNSWLSTTSNITPLTVTGQFSSLRNMQIQGLDNPTATHAAIRWTGQEAYIDNVRVVGGSANVSFSTNDCQFNNCTFTGSYSSAIFYTTSASGLYINRCVFDQNWPVSEPALGTSFSAWTNGHAYTSGTVVSTQGFLIQCTVSGTSGSVAPTLQPYSTNITDNTATWRLVCATTYYGFQMDTNSFACYLSDCDMTGPYNAGIAITNTLAGTPSSGLHCRGTTIQSCQQAGLLLTSGNSVTVHDCNIGIFTSSTCAGIQTTSAFTGEVMVSSCVITTCVHGIDFQVGTGFTVTNCVIGSNTTTGIHVAANLNQFTFTNNILGTSDFTANPIGIKIEAGTSNGFSIVGNVTTGCGTAVSNAASGTSQLVLTDGPIITQNIQDNAVSNAKLAQMATKTIKGNITAGTANATDLTAAQVQSIVTPALIYFNATGINFNSANTDTAISITLPFGCTRYRMNTVAIYGASGTLTTATCGVFTAPAAGGTNIVASGSAITVSTATDGTVNNTQQFTIINQITATYTLAGFPTIYFRVQNPQGSAATANVLITVLPVT